MKSGESQALKAFQDRIEDRTNRIQNVTSSIGKVRELFKDLNEIVMQQGETLNAFSDNIIRTKENTGEAVTELTTAQKNESPTI